MNTSLISQTYSLIIQGSLRISTSTKIKQVFLPLQEYFSSYFGYGEGGEFAEGLRECLNHQQQVFGKIKLLI